MVAVTMESGASAAEAVSLKSGDGVAEAVTFNSSGGVAEAITLKSGGGVAEAATFKSVKATAITLKSVHGVAEAATFNSGGGVDFGALGPREIGGGAAGVAASTVLEGVALGVVVGDRHPHDPLLLGGRPAVGANCHAAGVTGVGPPPKPAYPPLGAEHGGGADLRGREGDPLDDDVPANFRLAPGGGMAMASPQAAVLAMVLGAMTIIGEPDAPWPNQLVALLLWLGGCIGLFLPRY